MTSDTKSIIKVFVTLRSMEAKDLVVQAFEWPWYYRLWVKLSYYACMKHNSRDYQRIKLREIDGRWPCIDTPELPDNIQWKNMGVSKLERYVRRILVWMLAIFIICCAFAAILYLKNLNQDAAFKISAICPILVEKENAMFDF